MVCAVTVTKLQVQQLGSCKVLQFMLWLMNQ